MRILTFTSLFPNTVQREHGIFVLQRVAHLARWPGNEIKVVAPVPYFPRWLRIDGWHEFSLVPHTEWTGGLEVFHPRYPLLPNISMPLHGLLMFLSSVRRVRQLHRGKAFDCVDAHYVYPDGLAATLLGKMLGIPVIVSARGTDMNLFPRYRTIRPMIRWTLRQAAGSIAVCSALKQVMVDLGGPNLDVEVIGNGVDLTRFEPLDRAAARCKLGLPAEGRMVVSVGALIPRKGQHFLVRAFADVKREFPDARLYIVGGGESRGKLQGLVHEFCLGGSVFLMGNRPNDELKYWYSASDLSCLVSSREGWANVLLESLACGTPVVATNVWGAPEVLDSPGLGLLVNQDVESIAAGVATALGTAWNRDALVCRARQRTWDSVAAEVQRYIDSRTGDRR